MILGCLVSGAIVFFAWLQIGQIHKMVEKGSRPHLNASYLQMTQASEPTHMFFTDHLGGIHWDSISHNLTIGLLVAIGSASVGILGSYSVLYCESSSSVTLFISV